MFTAYHFILYLLLISTILISYKKGEEKFFWGLVAIMIFFAGLRYSGDYTDLGVYLYYYQTGEEIDQGFGTGAIHWGFKALNIVVGGLGLPFQFLLFIIAFFIYFTYAKYIRNNSPNKLLSLTIFYLTGFVFSLILLRQFIAVCIGLKAFQYVIKRKQIAFLITVGVALLFHFTALVLLPVYYLYGIRPSKKNLLILFVSFIGIILAFNVVALYMASFSEYYAHYIGKETESSIVRLFMKIYIMAIYIFSLKKCAIEKNINFLLLICLALNVIIYAGGSAVFGLFRLRTYFEISEIIGIPVILLYARSLSSGYRMLTRGLVFVYFILLILSFDRMVNNTDIIYTTDYHWCF